jgi:hypothetical protein
MPTVFLSRKRKSLYHRVWIPEALRGFFKGRSEVWRSLKTLDKEEARCRCSPVDEPSQARLCHTQEVRAFHDTCTD